MQVIEHLDGVAIPSKRVNVSYIEIALTSYNLHGARVAIPSKRVNVSYKRVSIGMMLATPFMTSQSPQSGSMFLTCNRRIKLWMHSAVAIPSKRVNVSYIDWHSASDAVWDALWSQSPQSGSMFLTYTMHCQIMNGLESLSQSPQSGSMFLTYPRLGLDPDKFFGVAIPSKRVNVSYSTPLFLRIIGNLTPLLREPRYFYAFFFPI